MEWFVSQLGAFSYCQQLALAQACHWLRVLALEVSFSVRVTDNAVDGVDCAPDCSADGVDASPVDYGSEVDHYPGSLSAGMAFRDNPGALEVLVNLRARQNSVNQSRLPIFQLGSAENLAYLFRPRFTCHGTA